MIKVNKVFGGISITLALCSSPTFAEGQTTGSGPNPFSDCGIGAALFPKHPVGAVISNVIWDVGTTAVTSATASPETCSGENAQVAAYIYESHGNLVEDAAKGQGEHLATLLSILNTDEAQQDETIADIRAQFASVVSTPEYSAMSDLEKSKALYNSLSAHTI